MEKDKNFIVGIYEDEDLLKGAVSAVRGSGIKIHEVYTPYPIHGMEDMLGYKRTRLPVAAFFFGLLGTCLALVMQISMLGYDWPVIVGGKDHVALPAFIPVTFEITVLLSAFGMVGVFLVSSNLKPWSQPRIFDIRSTDDRHVLAIDVANNLSVGQDRIKDVLKETGAVEVNDKSFE